MHNKSKGKIRDTYLERKWRPTEAAAGLAVKEKARGRGMQRKNEKARGRRLAEGRKAEARRRLSDSGRGEENYFNILNFFNEG